MREKKITNVPASISARIKNWAAANGLSDGDDAGGEMRDYGRVGVCEFANEGFL